MNDLILNIDVQAFINQNLNTDIPNLVLKGSPFSSLSVQELAQQIVSKKACKKKLPSWYNAQGIYYPNKINIEQSSSELTAGYKSQLISGNSLIDLTGGMGVDSYFFSDTFKKVIHCEQDEELSKLTAHNFQILTKDNIRCQSGDGIEFLKNEPTIYDWIFLDPSRRNDHKQKVFLLQHCTPDVALNMNLFLSRSDQIMIKLSPMLDLRSTIAQLKFVKEIHVIAVQNEVKELLFLIQKGYEEEIKLHAVNFSLNGIQHFESIFGNQAEASFSLPSTYLYEPNAALLKVGLFNQVSDQLQVSKIHNNSHLYTSKKLIDFPGRRFIIEDVSTFSLKNIKKKYSKTKANITTRNFKYSVDELRKLTKIKDGGSVYLFCTTNLENKAIVIQCKKV